MISDIIKDYEYCGHIINLSTKPGEEIIIRNSKPKIVSEELYNLVNSKNKRVKVYRENKLDILYDVNNKKCKYKYLKDKDIYIYEGKGIYLKENIITRLLYQDVVKTLEIIIQDKGRFLAILKSDITNSSTLNKEDIIKQLKKLDLEYSKLLELSFIGEISKEEFELKTNELNNKISEYNNILNDIKDNISKVSLLEIKFNKFISNIKYKDINKIDLIRLCIDRVVISRISRGNYDIKIKYKYEI
ncbi:MAG: hypothetical protein R3Y05_06425 [bacterium]